MKDVMFIPVFHFFLHIQFEDVNVLFYILGYFPLIKCVLYCTFNLINTNHTIMGNACCVTLKLILYILTDLQRSYRKMATLHIQFVDVYVLFNIFGYLVQLNVYCTVHLT